MNNENNTNKNKKLVISLIILALILIIAGGTWFFMGKNKKIDVNENVDPVVKERVEKIVELDHDKQKEELDKMVEEGMINIRYSSGATFNGKTSESFNVKNVKQNHHPIKFTIYDENGDEIYQSGEIDQGYEVNEITLDKELSKGTHECKIKIGYAIDTNITSVFPLTVEVK